MATSVYPAMGGAVDNTSAATFIPEIWSDEVVAAYQTNLILANLVKKMSMFRQEKVIPFTFLSLSVVLLTQK
jgi:hypothetical protein